MRILFYVEPVPFRNDPAFLSPIINTIRCFINANRRDDVTYALASSSTLLVAYDKWLAHGGLLTIERYKIDVRTLLEAYDFDRFAYSRDLFSTDPTTQGSLCQALSAIRDGFEPDVVLSPTQNTALQRVFGADKTLFFETGPLPRWDGRGNYYFDSGGHQLGSIIDTHLQAIQELPLSDQSAVLLAERFSSAYFQQRDFPGILDYFRTWLTSGAKGRKVALIANQPPDSILVDGGYGTLPTDGVMMRVLNDLPDGWVGIPTYHRDAPGSPEIESYLAEEFPNFLPLPTALKSFGSDPLIPACDALVTIGSKSAFTATLAGKPIVTLGQTMMSKISGARIADLNEATAFTQPDIGRLICFLSNRYEFSFEECFENNGALLDFFDGFVDASNKAAYQLDISRWTPGRFECLLGRV